MQDAISNLKKKGYKITKVRKEFLKHFISEDKPVNAGQLLTLLHNKHLMVNKTTVYREIEFLHKLGLVQEVYIDPKKVYYESSYIKHHHHFVCNNCGNLEDVFLGSELVKTEKKLEEENKFVIQKHSLEFFGLCANCK